MYNDELDNEILLKKKKNTTDFYENKLDIIKEDSDFDDTQVAVNSTRNNSIKESKGNSLLRFNTYLTFVNKFKLSHLIRKKLSKDEEVYEIKVNFHEKVFLKRKFEKDIIKTSNQLRDLLQSLICEKSKMKITFNGDLQLNIEKLLEKSLDQFKSIEIEVILNIINDILKYDEIKMSTRFIEFLELSQYGLDILYDGTITKEGYIYKKTNNKRHGCFLNLITCCLIKYCNCWQRRWFILQDDMICYLESSVSNIGRDVFWFDQEIKVLKDGERNLFLKNLSRGLSLKFQDELEREIWFREINRKIENYKSHAKNKYESFACKKENCNAEFLVDAHDYFSTLYRHLMEANESIYIAGWWVSPELFLNRPCNGKDKNQQPNKLMDVLLHKAKKGVQINVLIYKEFTVAMTINSSHTKTSFENLHPNIKVSRHPKGNFDLYWSHHEKIVIIDQTWAFIGGLDLCWGRYDTCDHRLTEPKNDNEIYHWPGIDYSNCRVKDFENVQDPYKELIDRNSVPRLPWHDVHVLLEGPVVGDLCRHFIERWNFSISNATFKNTKKNTIVRVKNTTKSSSSRRSRFKHMNSVFSNTTNSDYSGSSVMTPTTVEKPINSNKRFTKDFSKYSKHLEGITPIEEEIRFFESNQILKNEVKAIRTDNALNSKDTNDLDNSNKTIFESDSAFIRKLTYNKKSQKKLDTEDVIIVNDYLNRDEYDAYNTSPNRQRKSFITKFKDKFKETGNNMKKKIKNFLNYKGNNPDEDEEDERYDPNNMMPIRISTTPAIHGSYNKNYICQALRSASNWSVGLDKKDDTSILNAYYDLIDNSKFYIMIENQFFISKSFTDEEHSLTNNSVSSMIYNEIALRIRNRIEKAYRNNEKFRVFIFLPLQPAFPGEITESHTLHLIMKYTYKTISRNKGLSLYEKLYELMKDKVDDYIVFYSLRTHGIINEKPVTELIYIHSKLMLVDDEYAIIGSANINDRSMTGHRDSEIGVLINSEYKNEVLIDNRVYKVSENVRNLRIKLMKEHMGRVSDDNGLFYDPLSDKLFNKMKEIARKNTECYREIFRVYPDDTYRKFSDITKDERTNEEIKEIYLKKKGEIIGNIVEFPLDFLKEENLNRSYFCKEILVPIKNFL